MFRKKNGQEFMDETNLDSSTNDKEEKKGFFHRKKKKEINLYEDDMGYIEDDSNFDEDEYDKELEELQEEEKPEKKRGFFHRKKKEEEKSGDTEKLEGTKEEEESLLSDDDAIILQEPEKKKFSKKKLALICGTAAVIVIAVVFFVIRNIGGTSEGKAYVESVREITGLGTAGGANNRYTGTVEAEKSWKITLQSDLSVEKRYVNVGDQVKKGDKLFKYNTQELKLSKEKKELEQETLQNEITQLTKDIKSYQSDVASIEDGENGNEAVNSSYQVVTDNDRLFALRIDTSIVMAGSNQYTKIYNVDKKTGNTITLNDLFQKDSDYLDRISEEIEKQMKENMEKDSNLQYFLDKDVDGYSFDGIKNDVNFYVNKEGELTIVFDKYEVAPGYMGIVEFTIPTSVVSDIIKDGYLQ